MATEFQDLKHITLIGGGDLMASTALLLKELSFPVSAIVAPRHIDESLTIFTGTIREFFNEHAIDYHIIDNINKLNESNKTDIFVSRSLALCFGPAWVFNEKILASFSLGMFNINAIPIPRYLGGAHYSWQLLNNNFEGGCFFQEITKDVDRGDILDRHEFTISEMASTPQDYFLDNFSQGKIFLKSVVEKLLNNQSFSRQPYKELNDNRVYLPRLRTDKQGFINWQWHAADIVNFTKGFDKPYIGAGTYINETLIRISGLKLINLGPPMHPFASGIIIRKTDNSLVVSAIKGFIEIDNIVDENGNCMKSKLKEGMRIFTPMKILEDAMLYQTILTAKGFEN